MVVVKNKLVHRPVGLPAAAMVFLIGLAMAVAPRAALAHAVLVSSMPVSNGTVTGPDLTILLKYDSRVDGRRSTLSLLEPDGKVNTLAILPQSAPNLLSAKVSLPVKGAYVVRWQALASDGHVTRGEVPFRVR